MHLLIAEDDATIADVIEQVARVLWPDARITIAPDGATALRHFAAERPDLVILDLVMPPPDGFGVCQAIRQADATIPILILTGHTRLVDEVRALDLGADTYLTKPFDALKLLARLRALMRRNASARTGRGVEPHPARPSGSVVVTGDLAIDLAAREARLRGQPLALTPTEWVLLEALARDAGQIVSHHILLKRIWGVPDQRGDLKAYINRLRGKLGDNGRHPRYIETRRGEGYRLATR
jgi:DNA-binding response OmpR family regulator